MQLLCLMGYLREGAISRDIETKPLRYYLSGGLEAQANLTQMALGFAALLTYCLGVKEDSRLLLESLLRLQQQQPCGC